nr:MAG TPA: hypothetical protein [Caudoviricetes sp.]
MSSQITHLLHLCNLDMRCPFKSNLPITRLLITHFFSYLACRGETNKRKEEIWQEQKK